MPKEKQINKTESLIKKKIIIGSVCELIIIVCIICALSLFNRACARAFENEEFSQQSALLSSP